MADMKLPFEICLRPCLINEKHKAVFHKWVHVSEIRPPSLIKGGHSGGVVQGELGLIEAEDGTMHEVLPEHIKFLDSAMLFEQYDWGDH